MVVVDQISLNKFLMLPSCVLSQTLFRGDFVVALVACVKFYEWWSIGGGGPDCPQHEPTPGQVGKLLMLLPRVSSQTLLE